MNVWPVIVVNLKGKDPRSIFSLNILLSAELPKTSEQAEEAEDGVRLGRTAMKYFGGWNRCWKKGWR